MKKENIVEMEARMLKEHIGETIQIHGSIYKIRKMSDFAFVLLRTKRDVVQCVYSLECSNFSLEELVEESCVIVTAEVMAEERSKAGYELRMLEIEVLSTPEQQSAIVINNKRIDTSLENRLNYRPITLRNEKERAIFKIQEGLCRGFREFLYQQEFTEIMQMETEMLKYAFQFLQENYQKELELLKVAVPQITTIPSIKFSEAKELVAKTYQREIKDAWDFEPEEEKLLCEIMKKKTGSEFVFVTHYPSKKRPFYAMDNPERPEETLSFDLLFRGLEVTTGGQRIHNYAKQVEKMKQRGMNIEAFESYLMMHQHGMPPHGGLGLGLERLTSRLLEQENVRLSCLFPRDIHRVTP